MAQVEGEPGSRRFPDDYTNEELRAIITRALANGDGFSRALLRSHLEAEEFAAQAQ